MKTQVWKESIPNPFPSCISREVGSGWTWHCGLIPGTEFAAVNLISRGHIWHGFMQGGLRAAPEARGSNLGAYWERAEAAHTFWGSGEMWGKTSPNVHSWSSWRGPRAPSELLSARFLPHPRAEVTFSLSEPEMLLQTQCLTGQSWSVMSERESHDCGWASSPLHPHGDYFIHMWNNHVWKAEIQLLPPLATAVLDTVPRGTNRDILHFPLFCVFSDILEHGTPKPPADSVDFLITESCLQSGDWKHKTEVETVSLKLRDWNKGSKPIKPRNQRFSCFTWIRMMGKSRGVWLIGVPSG